MRRRGRLSRRVLIVMAVGLIVGLGLTIVAIGEGARVAVAALTERVGDGALNGELGVACEASPRRALSETARLDAYDPQMRPGDPASPPLSEREQAAVRAGELPFVESYPMLRGEGVVLFEGRAEGPCALIRLSWTPTEDQRAARLMGIVAVLMGVLAVCLGAGLRWVVRPLLRRIEELSAAAALVGGEEEPVWPAEEADELGVIATSMRGAHARILQDKAALAEKNLALRRHIADVAHDLRTPIASLQLALEGMEGEVSLAGEGLAQALSDAVYLEALTDNLGLAARLREGLAVEEAEAELGEVVRRVAGRLRLLARARGVALDFGVPEMEVFVAADPVALERALGNLAHNAVRYAEVGGHVALVLERREEGFELRVVDDGPGVPPASLPRLTDRAWRGGEARQRESTGTGLGLAITAEVCARAGFELGFEAVEPRGLLARVTGHCNTLPPHQ